MQRRRFILRAAVAPVVFASLLLLAACGSGGGGGGDLYSVTATAGPGGAIAPASATVVQGNTATFTITPDTGHRIDTVTGCGGTLTGTTYTTGPVTADCAITVAFTVAPATIAVTATAAPGTGGGIPGGTVTGAGSYAAGDPVTLRARPAPGFAFAGWEENGATVANTATYAFTALADRSLTARFRLAAPLRGDMPSSSATLALAVGDLDGDGRPDLVTVNGNVLTGGTTTYFDSRLWLGNGHGAFTDAGQRLPGQGGVFSVALGDIDGDGDLDVLLGGWKFIYIMRNDGRGVFTRTNLLINSFIYALALGDIDGDGDLDLVAGDGDGTNTTVFRNDGAGNFTDTGQAPGATLAGFVYALALGDLDGDGDLDLVIGKQGGANTVWRNDGSGTFTDTTQRLGAAPTHALALGDLDGDGDLDLVAGNGFGTNTTVWRNDGTGTFTDTGQALADIGSLNLPGRIALGDTDGDGDLDLVVYRNNISAGTPAPTILYRNDGAGIFTAARTFSTHTLAVALADLDGDGHLDLLEARSDGNPIVGNGATTGLPNRVWLNDGSGGFRPAVQRLAAAGNAASTIVARLDTDAWPDLAVLTGNGNIHIHPGTAGGHYAPTPAQTLTLLPPAGAPVAETKLAAADLDGDGDTDLVATDGGVHVWLNDGNGAFTSAGTPFGSNMISVAVGDLDGDGDLDLVTGVAVSGGASAISPWFNDGTAAFTAGTSLLTYANVLDLDLGDLDGDGDLDLVAALDPPAATIVFRNDGSGGFAMGQQILPCVARDAGGNCTATINETFAVALGDLDGDGRLDLAIGAKSYGTAIWLGRGDATFADSGRLLDAGVPGRILALAMGDLDGDGDLDLVTGREFLGTTDPTPNPVWINDGNAAFTHTGFAANHPASPTYGLTLADIDTDGDLDLIAAEWTEGIAIHRNATTP